MNWDEYFVSLCVLIATKSKDQNRKVGVVIVGPDNEIRSTGFNGAPRGVQERHDRPEKYFWTEHAERNAIYNAARCGISLKGCRIYLPWFPCMDCARGIIQSGITLIICRKPDLNDVKWGEDFKRVIALFDEAKITVQYAESHP